MVAMPSSEKEALIFTKDMAERAIATAAQAFLGIFTLTDLGSAEAALVAAGTALLAMAKALVASHMGDKGTASLVKA